ncbi:MAG TPA: DUF1385 domain-containing protein [Solirubrobacterales bacterium]|nr:DUF1385 domain-containing protein [Solirubrobacterales bacterium]
MSEEGATAISLADGSTASGNGAGPERLRLGGMALRNGLLIHGPTAWAAAARAPDGSIRVASGDKPSFAPRAGTLPLLRGPLKLAEAFAVVPLARRRLPEARLPFEDPRVLIAAIAATLAGGALRRGGTSSAARESLAAALGLLPAAVALRGSELAAYHGVEHKAIGAYEQGRPDPAEVAKEHERCGSHLIAPLLVLSVAGQLTVERLLERPGRVARLAAAVGAVSIAVELFAWCERNPDSAIARAVRRPGTEIQRLLATREPTAEQLEVGAAALDAILRAEGVGPLSAPGPH